MSHKRIISTIVLACFLVCSVAWTYDAYAGDDPLISGQTTESDDDGGPLSDKLPPLPSGGYCNLGCHLAGHLLGPISTVIPVGPTLACFHSEQVFFFSPRVQFVEPAVPPPIHPRTLS